MMKDKTTAAILALFLGGFGVHKFYLNQTGLGVAYLLFCWTFIPCLLALIDAIMLLTMDQGAFDLQYNGGTASIATVVAPNLTAGRAPADADFAAQLKKLHDLKVDGVLTAEEFDVEKQKILSRT